MSTQLDDPKRWYFNCFNLKVFSSCYNFFVNMKIFIYQYQVTNKNHRRNNFDIPVIKFCD